MNGHRSPVIYDHLELVGGSGGGSGPGVSKHYLYASALMQNNMLITKRHFSNFNGRLLTCQATYFIKKD